MSSPAFRVSPLSRAESSLASLGVVGSSVVFTTVMQDFINQNASFLSDTDYPDHKCASMPSTVDSISNLPMTLAVAELSTTET